MARHVVSSLFFDDLAIGDEWESPCRTVTEADVVAFAGLSGDFNPLHVDHEAARHGPFGKPVAHGLLGLAIVSGLASHAPLVATLAFLEIKEWKFLHPIHLGDTIQVITRVEALIPRSRGRRGVVTWHRRLVDQRGRTLQEGLTETLVRGRSSAPQGEDQVAPSGAEPIDRSLKSVPAEGRDSTRYDSRNSVNRRTCSMIAGSVGSRSMLLAPKKPAM